MSNSDIFDLLVDSTKAHPAFTSLKDSEAHAGARHLMNELYARMGDPDGNFIQDFQSDGFHSRMFEIACYAYLESQELKIDRSCQRPDFLASGKLGTVAIEAVTANPVSGRSTDISLRHLKQESFDEIVDKCDNEFPIRIGSSLYTKLKKRYWELPHCEGLPFVLLIGPFHEAGSTAYIDESLAAYLYGVQVFPDWVEHNGVLVRQIFVKEHQYGNKKIPSNFFGQPGCEHVSAILFCNQFTVPRFFRMAMMAGFDCRGITIHREGVCLLEEGAYLGYKYDMRDPGAPPEHWWQGVTIFHNPNARIPLPEGFLNSTSSFRYEDGRLERSVRGFHTMTSMMWMVKAPDVVNTR